ncbi:MAG TPA: cytochrome c oxidase assembly protein [Anaerolineae bacterium]|nr:cytochrome c oxidase assembly protein [Anaerolineae bacterium]
MPIESTVNIWRFDPSIVLGISALVGAYTFGAISLRRRGLWGKAITNRHVTFFTSGVLVLAFALMSPIDHIGEQYLFSIHMVQHILLAMVAPPLILLGLPRPMAQRALDFLRIGWLVKFVTHPLLAFIAFNTALIAWHVPALYEAALRNPLIHILEHVIFIGTGFQSWYSVIDPAGQHARFHPLAQIVYLFAFVLPSGVLGAVFAFAQQPIYAYYTQAPRLWGLTPLDDQALAGGIMWVPGWAIYFVALSIVFALWMRREDQAGMHPTGKPSN